MTVGSFATWNKMSTEVRLLLSHRNWKLTGLYSLILIFQRDGSKRRERKTGEQGDTDVTEANKKG